MEELRKFLAQLEFPIPVEALQLDGKIHRFACRGKRDDGWFIGWLNPKHDGSGHFCYARFGSHAGAKEEYEYRPTSLSKIDKVVMQERVKEAKKKLEIEREQLFSYAIQETEKLLKAGSPRGTTAYTEKKNLDGLYGAVLVQDQILVPLRDIDDKLSGAQKILPDGSKRFIKGTKKAGAFFLIGCLEGTVYLCEGFATGVSIHMATQKNVVIAFDADNLVRVAKEIRKKYFELELIICADNDQFKPSNKGRESAEAAGLAGMAAVILPQFSSLEGEPTDFNDLHVREGLEAVAKQLDTSKEPVAGFRCLGYSDRSNIFYNIEFSDIFEIPKGRINPQWLFYLAPENFWRQHYGHPEKDTINHNSAYNDLTQACLKSGRFDSGRIRGTGVWIDNGRVVVNCGDRLLVNGVERGMYWLEGQSIYIRDARRFPSFKRPLTLEECNKLLTVCEHLKWQDKNSAMFLPGWIAIARIAGALPVRPHVWITGSSSSGKSTVLSSIIHPALGGINGYIGAQGGTTEAGLRQALQASSLPVLFDEVESLSKITKDRHDAVLELLRNVWSSTAGQIIKGSAGGLSTGFNLSFAALLSSVSVTLVTEADQSRFTVMELLPHGDSTAQWDSLKLMIRQIDHEFGERLFARSIMQLPVILQSYETLKSAIAKVTRQRTGQQLGMLMAGWWSLRSDEPISSEQANSIAEDLDLSEQHQNRTIEERSCLDHLLTTLVRFDVSAPGVRMSIGDAISDNHFWHELKKYGVAVTDDDIFVAENHAELERIYAGTRWPNWTSFFRRLQGAEKSNPRRFGPGSTHRATKIPKKTIFD